MALEKWLSKEFIMLLPMIFVHFSLSTLNEPKLCVTQALGELLRAPTFMNVRPPPINLRIKQTIKNNIER